MIPSAQINPQLPLQLNPRAGRRFANFLATMNAPLVAELRRFAGGEKEPAVRWLWGAAGSGKTHLLSAWVAELAASGVPAGYLSMAQLPTAAMLQGMEAQEALALDDMEAVLGQPDWDEALFHLFNAMQDRGQRILFGSRMPLAELVAQRTMLPDLVSRLSTALAHALLPLSEDARMQALAQRAEERGMPLADEVMTYLRTRSARDAHALFALLEALDRQSLVDQRRITVPYLRQFLGS